MIEFTDDMLKINPRIKKYEGKRKDLLNSDVVFLSYPKSGRTWTRYFLANYFEIAKKQPHDIYFRSNDPKIHFTHNFFDWFQGIDYPVSIIDQNDYLDKKLILMIRDPRDVGVSYFHQHTNRDHTAEFSDIDNFVLDNIYGIERQSEFVLQAIDFFNNHKQPKIMLKYEDVLRDNNEFKPLIELIFNEVDEQAFIHSIEKSDFKQMRNKELSNFGGILGKKANWNGDENALKTRKAKIGSYEEELKLETIEKVNVMYYTNKLLKEHF